MSETIAQSYIEEGRQLGLARGREEGRLELLRRARATLLRLGQRRFQAPDELATQAINAITDLDRLDRMTDQLDAVTSWTALLAVV